MRKTLLAIISIIALCTLCFFGGRVNKRWDCVSPTNDTIKVDSIFGDITITEVVTII